MNNSSTLTQPFNFNTQSVSINLMKNKVDLYFVLAFGFFFFTFLNSILRIKQKLNQRNNLRTPMDYIIASIAYIIVHFLFSLLLSILLYFFPKITLSILLILN